MFSSSKILRFAPVGHENVEDMGIFLPAPSKGGEGVAQVEREGGFEELDSRLSR